MTLNLKIISLLIAMILANSLISEEAALSPQLAAYPQFLYSSETGFIFGVFLLYRYYAKNISDPELRNSLQFEMLYTEKKQFESAFEPVFYLFDGKTRLSGALKFRHLLH